MIDLPNKPFGTQDFSPRGGGIDFLGLRWVNLSIVGGELISELNNVTADMGTFLIAGWIPWKFRQLCITEEDFTEKNYISFREKIETAMSLTYRPESGIERPFGEARTRVGNSQIASLPCTLTFKNMKRSEQNTLYAAAVYGPVLWNFGFIKTYHAPSRTTRPTNIALAGTDDDTMAMQTALDASLKSAPCYDKLASLASPEFTWEDIRSLGEAGLDPARLRAPVHEKLKTCYRRKLLPADDSDPGYTRTITTRLLIATLGQRSDITSEQTRDAWYTGMFGDGQKLVFQDVAVADHCLRWSCFMARQYQRYIIELFLWCFETAIARGCRSIEEATDHWCKGANKAGVNFDRTFQEVLIKAAGDLWTGDADTTSKAWNETVHDNDARFEFIEEPRNDGAVAHALQMTAGWFWRIFTRLNDDKTIDLFKLGGADRLGMAWYLSWLDARRHQTVRQLVNDIFSDLVFSQHMRIALSRFDGQAQRLRFVLSDAGIEPTQSARADLGKRGLPWMPDRLDTLIALLSDADVIELQSGKLRLGSITF